MLKCDTKEVILIIIFIIGNGFGKNDILKN